MKTVQINRGLSLWLDEKRGSRQIGSDCKHTGRAYWVLTHWLKKSTGFEILALSH